MSVATTVRRRGEDLLRELTAAEATVACLVVAFRDRTVMVWRDDDYPLGTIIRYLRAGGRPVGLVWWDGAATRGKVFPDFGGNEEVGHHLEHLQALLTARLSAAGLGAIAQERAAAAGR